MSIAQVSYPTEAHYLTKNIEDKSFWYLHRTAVIINAIKNNIGGTPVIYDLGGGNGHISKALIDEGYNSILVEALPDAVATAKERGISSAIQSTIQDFKETGLPVVLLADVLEHVENDTEMLLQIHNQIAPGGTIVITIPAYNHLTTNVDEEIGHFRRYTTKSLADKLSNAGFIVKQQSYFFSLVYLPFVLCRVLPKKLGFNRKNNNTRRDNEHLSNVPWLNTIALKILQFECRLIRYNIKIPFGTSCILVAQKP